MRGPYAAWLDAKQARRNEAVPDTLRTPGARRLVRVADLALACTAVAGAAVCILIGIGVGVAWPYLVAGLFVVAGLAVGAVAVVRLARRERPDQQPDAT